MPNCIFIPTPPTTIAAIINTMDIVNKTVYEPGCGDGDFLKACLMANAARVIGSEPDARLNCHKLNVLPNCTVYCEKHEEIPEWSLKQIDYVYCYLMHGMMEPIITSLIPNNKKFTLISLNYPIPFWKDDVLSLEPSIRIRHKEGVYPPYALIYKYNVENGKVVNQMSIK